MNRIISIDHAGDSRIEAFRDIRERDLVGRGGFIAEGTVVVEQLLRSSRFAPTALLILTNRLAGLEPLLRTVPDDVPIYAAERTVMDEIAGFAIHRGVLAHGRRVEGSDEALRDTLATAAAAGVPVVVAVGIANHDNLGAIFRNAAAFGAGLVLLDEACCDPLYRKAIRVSAGGVLGVPFARCRDAFCAADMLRDAGFACFALSPAGSTGLHAAGSDRPVALFLGAEGPGLPQAFIGSIDSLRIEMAGDFDSLNVATAGAIALHHFGRRRIA